MLAVGAGQGKKRPGCPPWRSTTVGTFNATATCASPVSTLIRPSIVCSEAAAALPGELVFGVAGRVPSLPGPNGRKEPISQRLRAFDGIGRYRENMASESPAHYGAPSSRSEVFEIARLAPTRDGQRSAHARMLTEQLARSGRRPKMKLVISKSIGEAAQSGLEEHRVADSVRPKDQHRAPIWASGARHPTREASGVKDKRQHRRAHGPPGGQSPLRPLVIRNASGLPEHAAAPVAWSF